ncbi:30S ribosomal protein S8 [Candidatus Woesearchaeota archaeon]|nr:30S ribosomal protein S8 [Candidatus Woesearchaeota archaeon]
MSMNDPLANLMSNLNNAEKRYRKTLEVKPSSKLIMQVLQLLQDNHYIGEFKMIESNRGNYVQVNLINKINSCGVIKPRFAVAKDDFERFEKRFLLAKGFGVLIVSTTKGVITHEQAKEQGVGGRLLAYCY